MCGIAHLLLHRLDAISNLHGAASAIRRFGFGNARRNSDAVSLLLIQKAVFQTKLLSRGNRKEQNLPDDTPDLA